MCLIWILCIIRGNLIGLRLKVKIVGVSLNIFMNYWFKKIYNLLNFGISNMWYVWIYREGVERELKRGYGLFNI